MNKDDIIKLVEELSHFSNVVVNVFIVGDIYQNDNENASISIFGNCCNSNSDADFNVSV